MRYTVTDSRNKPEDGVSKMKYGFTEEYYTLDSETNEYTWESEYKINEQYSKIPLELSEDWLDAVMAYINDYNSKLNQNIKFKVDSGRSNAMYYTHKYINNVQVEEGWKDYGMLSGDEIDAWIDAVAEYHNREGIPMPGDDAKASLDKVNSLRSSLTTMFDSDTSGSTPSIPGAIALATSDPCKFPSAIIQAVKTGPTGPIDQMRNLINGAKQAINVAASISTDDFNTAVGSSMDPVTNTISQQVNGRSDKDNLAYEYFTKKYSTTITNMETVMEADPQETSGGNTTPQGGDNSSNEEPLLVSNNDKHEIPAWAREKITAAMKGRFGKNGVPSQDTISRYNTNKSYFASTFKKYGVPEQMTVLSIIESNVKNISTENSATAKGMWQFIRLTAQQYGLLKLQLKPGLGDNYNKYNSKNYNIVSSYDKRDQIEPATEAAAKLLRDIRKSRKKIYNWLLVAAGYNWGGGSVSKAITKAGNGASFWDVWKLMPLETRNYVCLTIGLNQYLGMSTDPLFE